MGIFCFKGLDIIVLNAKIIIYFYTAKKATEKFAYLALFSFLLKTGTLYLFHEQ